MDEFRAKIWDFYEIHGRHDLPWRTEVLPYGVLVSEIMLQQTQVSRVLVQYVKWMERFPDFEALAAASVAEVITVWQGLGYNRRALRLREAAQLVVRDYASALPDDPAELVKLPGVGANTAGAVAAFAYDRPVVFIETNIRRVFLHEFLADRAGVSDKELLPLIEEALERERPREWYWALMDYGSDLAKQVPNPNRRSKHYAVQSRFEGSARQLRGEVLRQLLAADKTLDEFMIDDPRLAAVVAALVQEGFVVRRGEGFGLAH